MTPPTAEVAAIMRPVHVEQEAERLRIRDEARRRVDAELAGRLEIPASTRLDDLLAVPDEPVRYRIDGLWPAGGRVMLSAQYKAGKSTTSLNLIRTLADGGRFLGEWAAEPAAHVTLIDNELDERTLRRWLRDLNIANPERVNVISLRGRVATFNIIDPDTRGRWADTIGSTDVLIFDCLRPVLDALSLSEDKEAGRFLVAFDALLGEAGIGEALLVHHAGHAGERARGDSRLRDWPDVEWRLVRDGDEPHAPSYFTAFGRDVDVRERRLAFEPSDRSLTVAGGSRRDAKVDDALAAVLEVLAGHTGDGMSGVAVERALTGVHGQKQVRAALRKASESGDVLVADGDHGARLHLLNPARQLVTPRQQLVNEAA